MSVQNDFFSPRRVLAERGAILSLFLSMVAAVVGVGIVVWALAHNKIRVDGITDVKFVSESVAAKKGDRLKPFSEIWSSGKFSRDQVFAGYIANMKDICSQIEMGAPKNIDVVTMDARGWGLAGTAEISAAKCSKLEKQRGLDSIFAASDAPFDGVAYQKAFLVTGASATDGF